MFCREALTWRQLSHPYVLPFWGVDLDTFPGYMTMVSPWMTAGTKIQHARESGLSGLNIDALVNFTPTITIYVGLPIAVVRGCPRCRISPLLKIYPQ
jgi:hypothetical protein